MDTPFSENIFNTVTSSTPYTLLTPPPSTPDISGMVNDMSGPIITPYPRHVGGGNTFYIQQLEQTCSTLRQQVISLKSEVVGLKVWKDAYEKLTAALGTEGSAAQGFAAAGPAAAKPPLRVYQRDELPLIKFWYSTDYKRYSKQQKAVSSSESKESKQKGNVRASLGINVQMTYVEDINGNIIDGFRASAIRTAGAALFFRFKGEGRDPLTWRQASSEVKNIWEEEMCRRFPELQYCAEGWKAQKVATSMYPGWAQHHGSKKVAIKEEPASDDENEEDPVKVTQDSKKRKGSSKHSARKKQKSDVVEDGEVVLCDLPKLTFVNPVFDENEASPPVSPAGTPRIACSSQPPANPSSSFAAVTLTEHEIESSNAKPHSSETGSKSPTDSSSELLKTIKTPGVPSPANSSLSPLVTPAGTPVIPLPPPSLPAPSLAAPRSDSLAMLSSAPAANFPAEFQPEGGNGEIMPPTQKDSALTQTTSAVLTMSAMSSAAPPMEPASALVTNLASSLHASTESPDPIVSNTDVTTKKTVKGNGTRIMRPSKTRTARNLCAIRWCDEHPKGSVAQFAVYWDSVKNTAIGQEFVQQAANASNALKTAAAP